MATLSLVGLSKRILPLLFCSLLLSGCAEIKTLVALFSGSNSLSTSAFEFDEIRSGTKVTCAILGDKSLRCLGSGVKGNLGTYNGGQVPITGEVKQMAVGKGFTCIVLGEKLQVFCFGRNDHGQLGNPSFGNSVNPVPVLDAETSNTPLTEVKMITAGETHACALLKSGRAICWGDNSFGQIGNPSLKDNATRSVLESEKNPKPMQNIHEIAAGANSTCVVARDDNTIFCFGERYGVTKKINWTPERIEVSAGIGTLANVKQMSIGRAFGCALVKNSQVYCWGKNDMNQLGALLNTPGSVKATYVLVSYPQEMPMSHIEQISVGDSHACAIHRDEKTVYCWGDNRYSQLGNTSVRGNPEQVALGSNNLTLKGVKGLGVGPDRTCIVSLRDEIFCWGNGTNGVLGNDKIVSAYPTRLLDDAGESVSGAKEVAVGYDHACLIQQGQKLYCFGINEFGQLGKKMVSGPAIFSDQKPVSKVTAFDTYGNKTCIVAGLEQGIYCFGEKEIDLLNKRPDRNSFIAEEVKRGMTSYKNAVAVSVGKNHICVIEQSQSVSCINFGDANTPQTSFTVNDAAGKPLRDIWQIRSRDDWDCALTQETGGIYCWGQWKNDRWPSARLIPTQGNQPPDYIQVAVSDGQICGIRGQDREIYCTTMGETSADKLEFHPVLDSKGKKVNKALAISGGKNHFCEVDEEGHLVCWGLNDAGQLGYKSAKDYQAATRINFNNNDSLKKIARVSTGDRHTCVATLEDPSLFCFGESLYGGSNSSEPTEYPL